MSRYGFLDEDSYRVLVRSAPNTAFSAPSVLQTPPPHPTIKLSDLGEEGRRWKWYGEVSSEIVWYASPRWIGSACGVIYKIRAVQVVGRLLPSLCNLYW